MKEIKDFIQELLKVADVRAELALVAAEYV